MFKVVLQNRTTFRKISHIEYSFERNFVSVVESFNNLGH